MRFTLKTDKSFNPFHPVTQNRNYMKALSEFFRHSSAYWGERSHWLVVLTTDRDADCLTRSNYRTAIQMLGGNGNEGAKGSQDINDNLAVDEATHWAVGWVQYLIVNPDCAELVAIANKIQEDLEDYPILDESDFSELEMEEANEVWSNCFRIKERIEYIRKHRSQFEFHDLRDMLSCVRGKYFAGYPSELLS